MFVCLKNKLTVGVFHLLFKKLKIIFKFEFSHIHQCTKLISHTLSQILNQNNNDQIDFILCHKLWTKITLIKLISYSLSKPVVALSYSIIISFKVI